MLLINAVPLLLIGSAAVVRVTDAGVLYAGRCSEFKATRRSAINPQVEPGSYYVAARWDYRALSRALGVRPREVKDRLRDCRLWVHNPATNASAYAQIADWGPARWTRRSLDCSAALMRALMAETDDVLQFCLCGPGREVPLMEVPDP